MDRGIALIRAAEAEIDLARKNIKKWEDSLERTRKTRDEILALPSNSRADVLAEYLIDQAVHYDELSIQRSKLEVEQGETKRDVLVKYEGPKRIRELQSEVDKAKVDEKYREATWDLEKQKEERLRKEIADDPLAALQKPLVEALKQALALDDELAGRMDQLGQAKAEDKAKFSQFLDQLAAKVQEVERLFEPWWAKKQQIHHNELKHRVRRTVDSPFARFRRVLPPKPPF